MLAKIRKAASRSIRWCILKIGYLHTPTYMRLYLKWLKKQGMRFAGEPNWIANDVYFDGSDYSLITIGGGVTISREVFILSHDFAVHTVCGGAVSEKLEEETITKLRHQDAVDKNRDLRGATIGDNTFIGVRALILPGTNIGKNCVIGAGAVVKGDVPDNSILVGNPAKVIAQTDLWLSKKAKKIGINEGGESKK